MIARFVEERVAEYDDFIKRLGSYGHSMYRGVSITWARKFRDFYRSTNSCDSNFCKDDVTRSRFRFIASRSPIGTMIDAHGCRIPYKLSWYTGWWSQVDTAYKRFKNHHAVEFHVNEDITIVKNLVVQVAKLLGIKTVVHLHGALGWKMGFLPLTADKIIVWDDRQKNKLAEWGLEADRIEVQFPHERYAKYLGMKEADVRAEVRKEFDIEEGKHIILVAPYTRSNYGDGGDEILQGSIKMMQDAINEYLTLPKPLLHFIIKLHPGSPDVRFWRNWMKENRLGSNVSIVRDYDSMNLAISSHNMIIHHSTFALDGLYLKRKKVFIIDDGMITSVEEFDGQFEKIVTKEDMHRAITWF